MLSTPRVGRVRPLTHPTPSHTPSTPPSQVDEYNTAYDAQQKRMNALKKEGKVTTALPLAPYPYPIPLTLTPNPNPNP